MAVIDHRPASRGGSCPRCRGSLGLASRQVNGCWYGSSVCAEGRVRGVSRSAAVPETWLYARPRRFFGQRQPKELNSTRAGE